MFTTDIPMNRGKGIMAIPLLTVHETGNEITIITKYGVQPRQKVMQHEFDTNGEVIERNVRIVCPTDNRSMHFTLFSRKGDS